MNKFFRNILALVLVSSITLTVRAQLVVGSFNLRLDIPKVDIGNEWSNRAPLVSSIIKFYEFDILGTQEGFAHQLEDLKKVLPNYGKYGVGRDDGKNAGEQSPIFYRKDKFDLLDNGSFWLSETPEQPSYGWDAQKYRRVCSWVLLKDKKTKKKFYFYNVHYDHEANIARRESSKLILQKIKENSKGLPVVLTGDFNGNRKSEWYKELAQSSILFDSYDKAPIRLENNPSFQGYGKANLLVSNEVIDHIFITPDFSVKKWGILSETFHGKYPSDHFPVIAFLEWKSKK